MILYENWYAGSQNNNNNNRTLHSISLKNQYYDISQKTITYIVAREALQIDLSLNFAIVEVDIKFHVFLEMEN